MQQLSSLPPMIPLCLFSKARQDKPFRNIKPLYPSRTLREIEIIEPLQFLVVPFYPCKCSRPSSRGLATPPLPTAGTGGFWVQGLAFCSTLLILYYIMLYYVLLYCSIVYYIINIKLSYIILHCIAANYIVSYCAILNYTVTNQVIHIIMYCIIFYYHCLKNRPYYIISYHIILYFII